MLNITIMYIVYIYTFVCHALMLLMDFRLMKLVIQN